MDQRRHRIRVCERVASEGGCLAHAAIALGISNSALIQWFDRWPDLSDLRCRLKDNARYGATRMVGDADTRIRLMADVARGHLTQAAAARRIGISSAALSNWRERNWIAIHEALYDKEAA